MKERKREREKEREQENEREKERERESEKERASDFPSEQRFGIKVLFQNLEIAQL